MRPPSAQANGNGHRRANSKRCLRHDFAAQNKSRSVFPHARGLAGACAPEDAAGAPSQIQPPPLRLKDIRNAPVHTRATKRELLRAQGERDFFLGAVRDVATELDLKALSHKAVDNIAVLLQADGASLFLVEGPRSGRQTLVSKVFDMHSGVGKFLLPGGAGTCDNEVQVPWGVGVLGHVAETGETVNLQVACEDPRFDDEVDRITGYHTDSLLCMPVKNAYDEVIAVAQVINKNPDLDGGTFTHKDEKMFETYLQFVGIAITNAQIMEASRQEYDRNRNLLEVVHDLFEEQTSLEQVILKIMQRAQRLLKCERASVLLLEENADAVTFSKLFELAPGRAHSSPRQPVVEGSNVSRYMLRLAERVVQSGEVLNVAESLEVEKGSGGNVRSLLAMPIRNRHYQTIGVATIINKLNGSPFDDNDEQLFEAFSIFCGLGIHNTLMYSEVEKAMARQKVAIEVLSYHATASSKEVEALLDQTVPCADELNLYSLAFDDFSLSDDDMVLAAVAMFLDLGVVKRFCIEREGCEMKGTFSDLEVLGMFVGCLCHDLDHRGTNNAFQEKTGSALVLLYGTTNTMEHHHFNHAVMILSSEGHNIFSGLSAEHYSKVMKVLKHSILATDLSVYFELRPRFFTLVESRQYSWGQPEHRQLLRSMLMTAADLAASSKPWPVQERVARLVTAEFLHQGERERRELHIQPQGLMDRERLHELPQLQIRWIADICLPLYKGALANISQWAALAPGVSNGHDDGQGEGDPEPDSGGGGDDDAVADPEPEPADVASPDADADADDVADDVADAAAEDELEQQAEEEEEEEEPV
ncbi:cGMP-specific 3',5'-cyclic phosphodiesterase [Gryllus bimaculatus]|nr:cGMP-specific 3',5'-cyclic phosphodiesterase [Gryllus bimaculatus]